MEKNPGWIWTLRRCQIVEKYTEVDYGEGHAPAYINHDGHTYESIPLLRG
jgi:hypothetical protein